MTRPPVTVHMIGNAHIDPVWLWRVGEGRQEVLDTYRSAVDRMDETPGFIFSSGGAITYRWVQEDDPDLFAIIQQRIAEGRWEIVNGWLIQPDCNIPSGESFVRQGLYGQRMFEAMFGQRAVTGYNVDSFGHAGSLPQILRGCGMENYVFFRPAPDHEKDLPGTLFWWESDDGAQVLTSRPPLHYPSRPGDLHERIDTAAAQAPSEIGHVMCFYGVGNHGGGPTKANLASICSAMGRKTGPTVKFGRTDVFFQAVRDSQADLPVLHDELQHHARGCYTAVSALKRYNRQSEQALITAEKWATLAAHYAGTTFPKPVLTTAWEGVLFNQFHDILAGTSLRNACEDAYRTYEASLETAAKTLDTALAASSAKIDTQGTGRALLVWNPHPWPLRTPIEATVPATKGWHDDWRGEFLPATLHLTDDQGQVLPCQVTEIEHDGSLYLLHLTFLADLPALGYRCYHWSPPDDLTGWQGLQEKETCVLENKHLRVEFDPETGWMRSLQDKLLTSNTGACPNLLSKAGAVPLVIDDPSDTWSHDVAAFDQLLGLFDAEGKVSLAEDGSVRQRLRTISHWGNSTITTDFVLYTGDPQLYITLDIDWHEQLKMLKLAFPFALHRAQSTIAIPYGQIQRLDNGGEEPCQEWIEIGGTVKGQPYGIALLNDSKYGYSAHHDDLRLSLLRSPVFAFHRPRQIMPGVTYRYTDQGHQQVKLALHPHLGTVTEGQVVRRAAVLNAPPVVREEPCHEGDWPAAASFLRCDTPNVILTVLKQAEEGTGWILRGIETAGQTAEAEIVLEMEGRTWNMTWQAYEIKTLRWQPGTEQLAEVNMLEE